MTTFNPIAAHRSKAARCRCECEGHSPPIYKEYTQQIVPVYIHQLNINVQRANGNSQDENEERKIQML
jgi:hypothetical protein